MSKKVAVVLFNLGGPDSKNAIAPFLMNFFMDKNIINLPIPLRCFVAKMISMKRSKREAGDSYGELGDKSPLLENSQAQAQALEKQLNADKSGKTYKVLISMRYWHPMAPQVVREVRDWQADKVILLPLYPQFSTTTTWSSLENWQKALHIADYKPETSMICCYPEDDGFIEASADNIARTYSQALDDGQKPEDIRILFSAHGLPEKVVKGGDPYQWQCERTSAKIAALLKVKLGTENLDWQNCYQSRVGPMKWIGPSTEEALDQAIEQGKSVLIYPHAFTQEHVETLVELDIEYKEIAEKKGIKGYYRAETVGTHETYITALKDLVLSHLDKTSIESNTGECLCPNEFNRCCMRMGSL